MATENQLYFADINYDALLEAVRSGKANTQIVTRRDGSTFRKVNVNIWVNAQPDSLKQDGSIIVQMKDEHRAEKHYIGNLKKYTPTAPVEATEEHFSEDEDDDLPF